MPRWKAIVHYMSEKGINGILDVEYEFEELYELNNLIEQGPDWNTIIKMEIKLARSTGPLTIEQAEKQ